MKNIIIFGAGGFGMEVAWLLEEINRREPLWNLLGYIDQDEKKWGKEYFGYGVLGSFDYLKRLSSNTAVVVAVGDSVRRNEIVAELSVYGFEFPVLVHPSVFMPRSIEPGEGTIMAAGTVLTVQVKIGAHVHVDTSCTVGHGAVLGDYSRLNPGVHVSGDVVIKTGAYIGAGAVVTQGIVVGSNTIVGAGAVVVRDLPDNVVAVGVPARVIRKREDGS